MEEKGNKIGENSGENLGENARGITPEEENQLNTLHHFCSKDFKNADLDREVGTSFQKLMKKDENWHRIINKW